MSALESLGLSETIAAIATAAGEASIAVIRVSGSEAVSQVDRIFRGGRSLGRMKSHTVSYGHIVTLSEAAVLDEVLVTVMRGPRTYTTEDVVEISTHGGMNTVQSVLAEVLRTGVRLAEPGEFTKRAFLGGRIDLAQAEGIMELIQAQTDSARVAALSQVEGGLTQRVRGMRQALLELMAHLEVTMDYPEHDEEDATTRLVAARIRELLEDLRALIRYARDGRILREGLRTVIVGRPNVGKSSLLNQLARADRAIVTDVPGTTRDVLEETLQIAGVRLRLADTAGLRETEDPVEQLGVARSRRAMGAAELLLVVIDGSRALEEDDVRLLANTRDVRRIILVNKADLPHVVDLDEVVRLAGESPVIRYCAVNETGLLDLESAVVDLSFSQGHPRDMTFLANARHLALFERAGDVLERVVVAAESRVTIDLLAADVREAWVLLGEVVGETPREDLLDQIFRQFCLGK
ncbi:MAG: tRNA uridine-5-carboxymethylaminomethyl(34) synthesis GTPase MnmE [Firmicutes bacterium]|nr:tRNA uridine-5-carboxymethylaminomethyl(34) synthesis GTPase MnmE [Bacillota bacterium]